MGQPEQHHRQSSMLLVDRYIVTEPPRPCFRCEVRFVRQRGSPSDSSTPLSSEDKFKRRNFARCKFCPAPPSSQIRTAFSNMAWKTGSSSPGDELAVRPLFFFARGASWT